MVKTDLFEKDEIEEFVKEHVKILNKVTKETWDDLWHLSNWIQTSFIYMKRDPNWKVGEKYIYIDREDLKDVHKEIFCAVLERSKRYNLLSKREMLTLWPSGPHLSETIKKHFDLFSVEEQEALLRQFKNLRDRIGVESFEDAIALKKTNQEWMVYEQLKHEKGSLDRLANELKDRDPSSQDYNYFY